jgi:hypothetical protein
MEYSMRAYGLTLAERFLADVLALWGFVLLLTVVPTAVFASDLHATSYVAGALTATTGFAGVMFLLAASGLRQNRPALELGLLTLLASAVAWGVSGAIAGSWISVGGGIAGLLLFGVIVFLRGVAIRARFKPRYLSTRQFETMVQIADTMIDSDGKQAINAIQIAVNVDHALAKLDSPVCRDIARTLTLVEWVLPIVILRPIPFSSLGSHERRRAVDRVVKGGTLLRAVFRDVARFLKLISNIGYYSSPQAMRQVGYVPFEERERSQGVSQAPASYPDPFSQEVRP